MSKYKLENIDYKKVYKKLAEHIARSRASRNNNSI